MSSAKRVRIPRVHGARGKVRASAIFLSLIVAIIAGVVVALFLLLRTNVIDETLRAEGVLNTLWVLSDGEGNALTTNVISFYPETGRAASFNIAGNTGAIYRSIDRTDRIDAVYKERGIASYKEEIERLIGKTVPFTIEISLDDFGALVDTLGGVSVFVPYPIDEADGEKRFLFPSGAVVLDGDKARDYLLYRAASDTDSELDERRQGVFISFLTAFGENRDVIFSRNNFAYFRDAFRSNLARGDLRDLLERMFAMDTEHITLQTVTGSPREVDGKVLIFPYYDGQLMKDIVNQTINTMVSQDTDARVYALVIQNGTTQQGLARNTGILLRSAGYEVLETENADRDDYENTRIIDHTGDREAAETLGDFLRCTNIVSGEAAREAEGGDASLQADFTLILGRDFDGRYVTGE